jgi:diadenylate cyclase
MFNNILTALSRFTVSDLVDILLVAVILYSLLLLIKETKAFPLALGLAIVAVILVVTQSGKLIVSNWILRNFIPYLIIAVIILFQGEIRRFLTGIGSRTLRKPLALRSFQERIEELFLAVDYMALKKIGALIAIEKEISLENYADRGTRVDAPMTKDLLVSIFFPQAPLHDGAIVIRGGSILAAGCLLPLPASHTLRGEFQTRTRHLAALGLSQETDAAVVVVSETTGGVSFVAKGVLQPVGDTEDLKLKLLDYLRQ